MDEKGHTKKLTPQEAYIFLFNPDVEDEGYIPEWVNNIDVNNIPQPDFAHGEHHIETVRSFARVMAVRNRTDEYWIKTIDQAAKYHDISQGYTLDDRVPIGTHQVASAVIAFILTGNKDISDLIELHSYDNILRYSPAIDPEAFQALRILVDADRIANMGYSGLVRSAYYWGYRDNPMQDSPNEIIKNREVCDTRVEQDGLSYDYEDRVRRYCLTNILPYLINNNLLEKAIYHCETNLQRFFGITRKEEAYLRKLAFDPKKLQSALNGDFDYHYFELDRLNDVYNNADNILETNDRYRYLFIRKAILEEEILAECRYIVFTQQHNKNEEFKILTQESIDFLLNKSPWKV